MIGKNKDKLKENELLNKLKKIISEFLFNL